MADSDTLPKVAGDTKTRATYPWWVDLMKWTLAQFLFPVAVCGFLLWNHHTVGKAMVDTLNAVKASLDQLNASMKNRAQ